MDPLAIALGLASPAGARARLSILLFHRVLATPDPLFPGEPDVDRFDEMLDWLTSWFNVLPLDEAVRRRAAGTLPARAAAITFDDGYADNYTTALPILQRHGVTATFFIATGYLDGGRMWNDRIIAAVRHCREPVLDVGGLGLGAHTLSSLDERRRAIDALIRKVKYLDPAQRDDVAAQIVERAGGDAGCDLMMSSVQVRELHAAGMQIGAHTVSHPILARLPPEAARAEIARSRDALRALLDEPVDLFAYPNGKPGSDYLPEHARMVRDLGFAAGFCTARGAAGRGADPMQLPRFTPWDRTRGRYGVRMLRNVLRPPSTT